MTQPLPMAGATANVNLAGLIKNDYRGNPSTLCQGCGHNSISNQIISAMYELSVMVLWNTAFAIVSAGLASLTFFAQPVVGTLLGWFFLGEKVTPLFLAGGVLIGLGLVIASLESEN